MTLRSCYVVAAAAALMAAPIARGNDQFVDLASSAGSFEWNVFGADPNVPYAGPHAPDVRAEGIGSAAMTVSNVTIPPGAPGPMITSGFDLYAGSSIATHTLSLTDAEAGQSQTTLVLQLAVATGGTPLSTDSLLLGGSMAPTEFVNRGAGPGGTSYCWAEWQATAADSYSVEFGGGPHLSLRGVQLDYVNSATTFDAMAPGPVPEPGAATLIVLGLGAIVAAGGRRRRSH
jgi:hypothetical protein